MALRPYWKGYLKLSLVTCPVAMSPATSESEKVRFHTLNKATGNRVVSQYVNSITRKPVKDENEIKGYARGENDYVMLPEDELDAVALDTVKTIDIEKFVPRDSIEWIYLEKPHYLMPDDPVGHEAFAVIRDAMAADKVLGISRLVIGRRERAIVLEPRGEGIVVWTLRFGDEVRPENPISRISRRSRIRISSLSSKASSSSIPKPGRLTWCRTRCRKLCWTSSPRKRRL